MKAITAKVLRDRRNKKRIKHLKEVRQIIQALARHDRKEEK